MDRGLGQNGTFVLGTARCGSTMVSEILNLHPDILSLSEFLGGHATRCLMPGSVSGATYWKRLSVQTPIFRRALTPENAPREFLYRSPPGRYPLDKVPPILAMTLPALSADPDRLYDELAEKIRTYPRQPVEAHHQMLFEELMARGGKTSWVERTGMSLMWARILPQLFPEAKFVFMHRDGRDVALSLQAFKTFRPMIWLWIWNRRLGGDIGRKAAMRDGDGASRGRRKRAKPSTAQRVLDSISALYPTLIANPIDLDAPLGRGRLSVFNEMFFGRVAPVDWMIDTPPPLKHCAAFWSRMTLQAIPEFLSLPAERRHVLRYEDLTSDPEGQLTALMDFLGAEAPPAWLEAACRIPKKLDPRWQALPAEQQKKLAKWTEQARAEIEATLT